MDRVYSRGVPLFLAVSLFAGCGGPAPAPVVIDAEAEIQKHLATLPPDDRRLAAEQRYCPAMPEVRLGEMGPPHKIRIKGETLFVCCTSCVAQAREEPDAVLARLKDIWAARQAALPRP